MYKESLGSLAGLYSKVLCGVGSPFQIYDSWLGLAATKIHGIVSVQKNSGE